MRALVGLVLVAALAACGSKHEAQAASGGCDLAGLYRLRFDLGAGQWLWLRFRIAPDGLSATLEKPWAFARDKHAAPIKLDAEPAACKASLIASSTTADIHAAITLDPKTNTVTGKLELVGGRTGVPLEGVRDAGAVPTGHTCISPGMYRLVVPKDQVWRSDEKDGDCGDAELSVSFSSSRSATSSSSRRSTPTAHPRGRRRTRRSSSRATSRSGSATARTWCRRG